MDKRYPLWEYKICRKCNYQRNKENVLKNPLKRLRMQRLWDWKKRGVLDPELGLGLILSTKECQLCGSRDKVLHLDHNHKTGKIRGVLCTTCNLGLGALQENPELMRKAAGYVEFHDRDGNTVY